MVIAAIVLLVSGVGGFLFRAAFSRISGLDSDSLILLSILAAALGGGILVGRLAKGPSVPGSWLYGWRIARAAALALIALLMLMTIAIYVQAPSGLDRAEITSLCFVAAFSGAVGFGELTERYRDDPMRLFASDPTIIYVCVNIAAAIGALALIREFDVFAAEKPHRAIYEVLLASFGSIAFFRSSLFTARVGDRDVDVGPSTLLKSLLDTSDRMINRSQARDRANDAATIMRRVDFAKARAALPAFCFTVVENVTANDQERIGTAINQLTEADMTDQQRSIILGIYLMREVGPLVLERAVNALGDSIIISV